MHLSNTPKKQIYKGAIPTSILNHERVNQNVNRFNTVNVMKSNNKIKNKKYSKFVYSDYLLLSPKNTLKNVKKFNNPEELKFQDSLKLNKKADSPFLNHDLNIENYKYVMSPVLHARANDESPIQKMEKKDNNKQIEHEINVKMIFYFLINKNMLK